MDNNNNSDNKTSIPILDYNNNNREGVAGLVLTIRFIRYASRIYIKIIDPKTTILRKKQIEILSKRSSKVIISVTGGATRR